MATIASLAVSISANTGALVKDLDRARGLVQNFNTNITQINSGGGSMAAGASSALGPIAAIAAAVASLGFVSKGAEMAMSGLGSVFEGLKWGIQLAAQAEQAQIAFTSMLGSGEAATEMLSNLTDLAARTPFETTTLREGAQRLLAYGFAAQDVIPILTRLGDIASASPNGLADAMQRVVLALGQMQGKGRVAGQEMNQLTEAGIPAWAALAKSMGVSVAAAQHMVEEGLVPAHKGINAILEMANDPKFAGLMDKQSQSLAGLWSTLADNAKITMASVGQTFADAFDLKGLMGQVIDFTGEVRTSIGAIKDVIQDVMSDTSHWGDTWGGLSDLAGMAISAILDGVDLVLTAVDDWSPVIAKVFAEIQREVEQTIKVFKAAWDILAALNKALGGLTGLGLDELFQGLGKGEHTNFGGMFQDFREQFNLAKQKREVDAWIDAWARGDDVFNGIAAAARDMTKEFAEGMKISESVLTPLQQFQDEMANLQRLFAEKAFNKDTFDLAAAKTFKDLEKSLPKLEFKAVGGFEAGSKDALSVITKAQMQAMNQASQDPQKRIEDVLKRAEALQKQQLEEAKATRKALEANPIKQGVF